MTKYSKNILKCYTCRHCDGKGKIYNCCEDCKTFTSCYHCDGKGLISLKLCKKCDKGKVYDCCKNCKTFTSCDQCNGNIFDSNSDTE